MRRAVSSHSALSRERQPFDGLHAYPSPGPVLVHRDVREPFAGEGFPEELRALPLVLEGYDDARMIAHRVHASGDNVESGIASLFARPDVVYIYVRNGEAGCFIAHIARQ